MFLIGTTTKRRTDIKILGNQRLNFSSSIVKDQQEDVGGRPLVSMFHWLNIKLTVDKYSGTIICSINYVSALDVVGRLGTCNYERELKS